LLELDRALWRAARPLAQPLYLACLGEDEQREDRDSNESHKRGDRPDLREGVRQG
jgi:hypothetical protein